MKFVINMAELKLILNQPDVKILCSFIAFPETNPGNSYWSKKILQQKMEKNSLSQDESESSGNCPSQAALHNSKGY